MIKKTMIITSIALLAIVLGLGSITPAVFAGGDTDNDGIPDGSDNCPTVPNPKQSNIDGDAFGNLCDVDDSYVAGINCNGPDATIWWTGTGTTGWKTFNGAIVVDHPAPIDPVFPDVNGTPTPTFVVSATKGEDVMNGSPFADLMKVGKGNDFACGRGANDTLQGGHGDDELKGNSGQDLLKGGHGDDLLFGGPANDTLEGGRGLDTLDGGSGTADTCKVGPAKDGVDPPKVGCELPV